MINETKHIGSLLGRVFLISQYSCIKQWGGSKENINGSCDYDSLENFISYTEGDLTLFNRDTKGLNSLFYIFFSLSSKVEVFKINNGFVLCDGLYFNESWNYSIPIEFEKIEDTNFKIEVIDTSLIIADAVIQGSDIIEKTMEGAYNIASHNFNSYSVIRLDNGTYTAKRINAHLAVDTQKVILKGIEISR